jgi:hypothetical protein
MMEHPGSVLLPAEMMGQILNSVCLRMSWLVDLIDPAATGYGCVCRFNHSTLHSAKEITGTVKTVFMPLLQFYLPLLLSEIFEVQRQNNR